MTNLEGGQRSCTFCSISSSELDQPLKRCSRCHITAYCSRACQKAHWSSHKLACRQNEPADHTPVATPPKTIICTLPLYPEEPEEGTIFYLKTTRSYICDISVSGPYYPLGMIIPQVLHNLHDSSNGSAMFSETFPRTEGQNGLNQFSHIIAPLDKEPENNIKIELIRQCESAIAKTLPGPTYVVLLQTPSQTVTDAMRMLVTLDEYLPMEAVEVCGTYLTRNEAETKAKTQIKQKQKMYPEGREIILEWRKDGQGEVFLATLIPKAPSGTMIPLVIAQARYDSGHVSKKPAPK